MNRELPTFGRNGCSYLGKPLGWRDRMGSRSGTLRGWCPVSCASCKGPGLIPGPVSPETLPDLR